MPMSTIVYVPLHPDSVGESSIQVLWLICKTASGHSFCPRARFSGTKMVLRCTVHNRINRMPLYACAHQATSPGIHSNRPIRRCGTHAQAALPRFHSSHRHQISRCFFKCKGTRLLYQELSSVGSQSIAGQTYQAAPPRPHSSHG